MKLTALIALGIVGLFVLTAVIALQLKKASITPDDRIDAVFASSPDCLAPCWHGITPGISTRDDFLELLDNPPQQLRWPSSLRQRYINRATTTYRWSDPLMMLSGSVQITVDSVTRLTFHFHRKSDVTMGLIVERLGPPDQYIANIIGSHNLLFIMELFYEEGNLVVSSLVELDPFQFDLLDCVIEVTPDMPVREVYFLGESPPHLWTNKLNIPPTSGRPQPWHGFAETPLTATRCQN